jgi:hypothetical protein
MQMSRRVRHPERIIVLCPERGLKKSTGGIFEAEIIKALAEFGDTEARLLVEDESQLQKVREDLAAQIITPTHNPVGKAPSKSRVRAQRICGNIC